MSDRTPEPDPLAPTGGIVPPYMHLPEPPLEGELLDMHPSSLYLGLELLRTVALVVIAIALVVIA